MTEDEFERLLLFLADEETSGPTPDADTVNELVVEAASLLSDLRMAADDLAGAATWQQIAVESGRVQSDAELDEEFRRTR